MDETHKRSAEELRLDCLREVVKLAVESIKAKSVDYSNLTAAEMVKDAEKFAKFVLNG